VSFFPNFVILGSGTIKIEPAEDVVTPVGSVVAFNCTKRDVGISFGWRAYTSATESEFGTLDNKDSLVALGISLAYPSDDLSRLSLRVTDDTVKAVRCQYYDSFKGDVIHSETVKIFVVGKLISSKLESFFYIIINNVL